MVAPKFPNSEAQVDALVAAFYARARVDPDLGPVVMDAIGDSQGAWQDHEAKISAFWRNAVGLDRGYSGNPMRKHMANSDILPDQFTTWLQLFSKAAKTRLRQRPLRESQRGLIALGMAYSSGLPNFAIETVCPLV